MAGGRERQARSSFAAACNAKTSLEASTRYSAYLARLRWSKCRSQPTIGFQLAKIWLTIRESLFLNAERLTFL
jgi:hypothetical protein